MTTSRDNSRGGGGLVHIGELISPGSTNRRPGGPVLPRAEIPNWDEWQRLVARAAESRRVTDPSVKKAQSPQMEFKFDSRP